MTKEGEVSKYQKTDALTNKSSQDTTEWIWAPCYIIVFPSFGVKTM